MGLSSFSSYTCHHVTLWSVPDSVAFHSIGFWVQRADLSSFNLQCWTGSVCVGNKTGKLDDDDVDGCGDDIF